jgi:hypothetical protein
VRHFLFSAGAACLYFAVIWLAGYALERFVLPVDRAWRGLARFNLGLLAAISWGFILLATGFFGRIALLVTIVVVVVCAYLASRLRPETDFDPEPARRSWAIWPSTVAAAIFLPLFLVAINPTVLFDAAVYHLTLPRLYIEQGAFREQPFLLYEKWPQATEILFAWALLAKDEILAKLVHFGCGVLTFWALVDVGSKLGPDARRGRVIGWLGAFFFLANQVVFFELPLAYVELTQAFFYLSAFLFFSHACDQRARWSFVLAGAAMGGVAGIKLNGFVGLLPLLVLALPGWRRLMRPFLGYFLPAMLLLWLPWVAKTWTATGNPFFPFFHRYFGGPDWNEALTAQLLAWQSAIGMGREPLDYLLLPWRVIVAGGRSYDSFDGALGWHWLLLVPLALFAWRRPGVAPPLLVSGLFFVLWAMTSQQMRLLIPILPLLGLSCATAVVAWVDLESLARRRRLIVPLLAMSALGYVAWSQVDIFEKGLRHARIYLDPAFSLSRHPAAPAVFQTINQLPADAKILMLQSNEGFYCRREFIADTFFEASQISAWLDAPAAEEILKRLREREVSHLLWARRLEPIAYPRGLLDLIIDPLRVEVVFEDRHHLLLSLRAGP